MWRGIYPVVISYYWVIPFGSQRAHRRGFETIMQTVSGASALPRRAHKARSQGNPLTCKGCRKWDIFYSPSGLAAILRSWEHKPWNLGGKYRFPRKTSGVGWTFWICRQLQCVQAVIHTPPDWRKPGLQESNDAARLHNIVIEMQQEQIVKTTVTACFATFSFTAWLSHNCALQVQWHWF